MPTPRQSPPAAPLEASSGAIVERIVALGQELLDGIGAVLDELPAAARGPQALASELGLDKVLCSRLLKAIRKSRDPLAVVHHVPGPEPLGRFLRGARRVGVAPELLSTAGAVVERFKAFLRDEMGDRGNLEVVISTWLPEARREFELRRKQAAFRAMSQLRGIHSQVRLAAVFLAPSAEPGRLDVVWVMGHFGLRCLRPGAWARFATRRMVAAEVGSGRHPETLSGVPGSFPESYRLDEFCEAPAAPIAAEVHGEVTSYLVTGAGVGPGSEVDLILCEVNRSELPDHVPLGSSRRAHFSCEAATPAKRMILDAFVHRDVYPGSTPELHLYDRVQGATGDINDPANAAYRLDMAESVAPLGSDPANFRADAIGSYQDIFLTVLRRLGWDPAAFTGHRVQVEYPVLGTQVALVFQPPQR